MREREREGGGGQNGEVKQADEQTIPDCDERIKRHKLMRIHHIFSLL